MVAANGGLPNRQIAAMAKPLRKLGWLVYVKPGSTHTVWHWPESSKVCQTASSPRSSAGFYIIATRVKKYAEEVGAPLPPGWKAVT